MISPCDIVSNVRRYAATLSCHTSDIDRSQAACSHEHGPLPRSRNVSLCQGHDAVLMIVLIAQVADMEVETMQMKVALQAAEQAATPEVVHLKTLLCDPAVAHEFTLLREENKSLQTEVRRQGDVIQGLQSKPADPVRCSLTVAVVKVTAWRNCAGTTSPFLLACNQCWLPVAAPGKLKCLVSPVHDNNHCGAKVQNWTSITDS
jgi:hypothetical protein